MSSRRNSLSPPERVHTQDPGAHDLETSDSEEHYSDAQSAVSESHPTSPIPKTRVERVDDKPAYGEVPGTEAYQKREEDAAPDEIAYVPDPTSAAETAPGAEQDGTPPTPGGQPIPKTVVEESPDVEGSVTHPEIEKRHGSDPHPDVVLKADGHKVVEDGGAPDTPISPTLNTPASARARRKSSLAQRRSPLSPSFPGPRSPGLQSAAGEGEEEDGDDFGDDFDDFEEGGDDGDFDDFDDDGFQQAEKASAPPPAAAQAPAIPPQSALSFPIPEFNDLEASEIFGITESYLDALFPHEDETPPLLPPISKDNPVFLTPRSASLWSQLVAPPPLQPPDWIRSRIRRLFLVSLGVPVDLDEILPASKQKKLVLPSLHRVSSNGSFRRDSSESRSLSRARQAHRTSVDSQGNLKPTSSSSKPPGGEPSTSPSLSTNNLYAGAGSSKRKGPALSDPSFNLTAARQLCATTDEALRGMTDEELKTHVAKLEAMQGTVKEVLEYWQKRTDEKIGDREAFEGVIENLVKHARKVRK
ncbi:hypothetical protein B0T16DRAFT_340472 [Cercophora newfieldiana]|uniref:Uncharacterized protein n=1 Tax=Cercophora newfieldiana TaxID=92897 RepID=A0AA39YU27_9PEZI|nr:hypothetical protein B0T16DRAFT_340472 [Cercophora newfieldiana]